MIANSIGAFFSMNAPTKILYGEKDNLTSFETMKDFECILDAFPCWEKNMIRKAKVEDISRIAEILVFVKRMDYRSIFNNDDYSFIIILIFLNSPKLVWICL